MPGKTKFVLVNITLLLLKRVLLVDLIIVLGVLISFLFTKGFTSTALSDRLFIVGMGFAMLGGLIIITRNMPGRKVAGSEKKPASAAKSDPEAELEPRPEPTPDEQRQQLKQKIEKAFSLSTCLFLIGLVSILLSALVIYI